VGRWGAGRWTTARGVTRRSCIYLCRSSLVRSSCSPWQVRPPRQRASRMARARRCSSGCRVQRSTYWCRCLPRRGAIDHRARLSSTASLVLGSSHCADASVRYGEDVDTVQLLAVLDQVQAASAHPLAQLERACRVRLSKRALRESALRGRRTVLRVRPWAELDLVRRSRRRCSRRSRRARPTF
jgi:hypothetical protein